MFKLKKQFFTIILIIAGYIGWAQTTPQSPSVSSMIHFEEYPTDLYTGAPQISIPLYKLPTRNDLFNIGISLNYHTLALSNEFEKSGDVGRGWNLTNGGVITRIIRGVPDDVGSNSETDQFVFSFMGNSGKFVVGHSQDGKVFPLIMENNENPVSIEFETDFLDKKKILAFKIFDYKGFCYIFRSADILHYGGSSYSSKVAYRLNEIKDNNSQTIVTFNYTPYLVSGETHQILTAINSPGFGTMNFSHVATTDNNWLRFTQITVSDFLNNPVRKFKFIYEDDGDESRLIRVDESDPNETDVLSHKIYYKDTQGQTSLTPRYDKWGYFNGYESYSLYSEDCDWSSLTDTQLCSEGVVEKIVFPTGGCVLYDFESNTYSYDKGVALDEGNSGFFTSLDEIENNHNFTITTLASKGLTSSDNVLTFSSNGVTPLYIYINGYVPPLGRSPKFSLSGTIYSWGFPPYTSNLNGCKGQSLLLPQGNYTITSNGTGLVTVSTVVQNPSIRKWWNGGGIRIKRIGYFAEDVPQDYYRGGASMVSPSREISYNYNFFNESTRSSGSLSEDTGLGSARVRYKNITVTDSNAKGKTQYTYYTNIDFPQQATARDYREGNALKKELFDDNGNLVFKTELQYITETDNVDNETGYPINYFGWIVPTRIINTEYATTGSFVSETKYRYNSSRLLSEIETSGSRLGEINLTKLTYNTGNSPYSKNRIADVDKIEVYDEAGLLSTSKIVYSNSWSLPQGGTLVNQSYLPQQIQVSKGASSLETVTKNNLYDLYGHPIEIEEEKGIKKVFIYGYNNSLIVAEVENISYSSIPQTLITNIQAASDSGNESLLKTRLNELRAASQLASSFITTYTYKPLIGIATMTDARGYTTSYEYDIHNRKYIVKDQDNNIIVENQYNTQPQN